MSTVFFFVVVIFLNSFIPFSFLLLLLLFLTSLVQAQEEAHEGAAQEDQARAGPGTNYFFVSISSEFLSFSC